MASSRTPGPLSARVEVVAPSRTPGPMGHNDQADPNVFSSVGDTPSPLGWNDDLYLRCGSGEEIVLFIRTESNLDRVAQVMKRLGATVPRELMEGDFS